MTVFGNFRPKLSYYSLCLQEKHEQREEKLKSIDAKIKASQASKQQGKSKRSELMDRNLCDSKFTWCFHTIIPKFELFIMISVRQVKLAYVHTEAKAPPQVRRRQARHGTGHGVVVAPPPTIRPAKISSSSSSRSATATPMRAAVVSPRRSSMLCVSLIVCSGLGGGKAGADLSMFLISDNFNA